MVKPPSTPGPADPYSTVDAHTRRPVDGLGLAFGILFGVVALVGLTGTAWLVLHASVAWWAAGIVAVIGLALIGSSVPKR